MRVLGAVGEWVDEDSGVDVEAVDDSLSVDLEGGDGSVSEDSGIDEQRVHNPHGPLCILQQENSRSREYWCGGLCILAFCLLYAGLSALAMGAAYEDSLLKILGGLMCTAGLVLLVASMCCCRALTDAQRR